MKWTNEAIISVLQSNSPNGVIRFSDRGLKSTVKCAAIRRFGSWDNACSAAGVQPGKNFNENAPPYKQPVTQETIERGLKVLAAWGIDYERARG